MVIDSSALLAVLTNEPDRAAYTRALEAAAERLLSAVSLVETSIVMEARHGPGGVRLLDVLLERADITIVPVDIAQARLAREAYSRFGKGRHAAGLNFGDCFPYALAMARQTALLFKGNDFAHTDVQPALRSDA